MNRCRAVGPIVALIASAGCDATSAPPASVVRDSAGVRIVENTAAQWTPETAWRISPAPLPQIGGGGNDPAQELYQVRGAIRLSNGNIVVANSGTNELRFFTEAGSHIRSVGGDGEGPGEFRSLIWTRQLAADSLAAFDARLRRISYFDEDGTFARSVLLAGNDAVQLPQAVGVFTDGTLLVRAPTLPAGSRRNGLYRTPDRLFRYDLNGGTLDSAGWSVGREAFSYMVGGGGMGGPPHFGRSTQYAVHDSLFYIATNDTYEIKVLEASGALRSLVRKRHDNLLVTDDDLSVYEEEFFGRLEGAPPALRQGVREMFEAMSYPETMPAFGRSGAAGPTFHVDSDANLWVLEYNRPGDERLRWTVFDPTGVLLGTLNAPDDVDILDIGSDYVLGVWRDEDDVEHVMMYELVKP